MESTCTSDVPEFYGIHLTLEKYTRLENIITFLQDLQIVSSCYCYIFEDSVEIKQLCKFCLNEDDVPFVRIQEKEKTEFTPTNSFPPLKKHYEIPFISSDSLENKDNNDPNWDYLRKLKTDDERYKVVKEVWRNHRVPDPNMNTTLIFTSKKSQKDHSQVICEQTSKKRPLDTPHTMQPSKKLRLFNDFSFYTKRIQNTIKKVNEDFERMKNGYYNNTQKQKFKSRYIEKLKQIKSGEIEAKSMIKYYAGLPNQVLPTQQKIEDQEREIQKMITCFQKFYRWDGSLFYPGRV